MSELTTAGLVVGVEAEECNKIIRVQAVQVKGEMEEPKEAAGKAGLTMQRTWKARM